MATYTDNFNSYTIGNLSTQGNWITCDNDMSVIDDSGNKKITSGTILLYNQATRNTGTVTSNQYSQLTITDLAFSNYIGVCVRASTSNYYAYIVSLNHRMVIKVVDGEATIIDELGENYLSVNDVFKLSISGTTLTCYRNGSIDTALTGGGIYTDTSLSSGSVGVVARLNDSGANLTAGDIWEGGDLSGETMLSINLKFIKIG